MRGIPIVRGLSIQAWLHGSERTGTDMVKDEWIGWCLAIGASLATGCAVECTNDGCGGVLTRVAVEAAPARRYVEIAFGVPGADPELRCRANVGQTACEPHVNLTWQDAAVISITTAATGNWKDRVSVGYAADGSSIVWREISLRSERGKLHEQQCGDCDVLAGAVSF